MKVTLNWLKEFVDIDLSPQELAHKLTHAGLEVESIEMVGVIPSSVVTVQIEKIEPHPQADRLTLCQVNLGRETRKIVCGAKNMKEKDKVPLALPGTLLPNGKTIERSTIRGMVSEGMLCSEPELGLAEESAGLLILPSDTPLGLPLTEALPITDTLFEINVTPNRADCLSVIGIAREIAAITGKAFKPLSPQLPKGKFSLKDHLRVEVASSDKELCPRYTARMVRGVRVKSSPFEVKLRLERVGVRSINNLVDATNYVMIETGQPLHAFDYRQIAKGTIRIERASKGAKLNTLDQVERELTGEDLLIIDPEKVLAVAGVMGGEASGIMADTEMIVLESAYFQPVSVRKTSKRLGLQTESSYRFERGVDPNGVRFASDRAIQLILQWAGGELSSEVLDTAPNEFPSPKILLRRARTNALLGIDLDAKVIQSILERLTFQPKMKSKETWECQIPTYRNDLEREIDLIEEVARIFGYPQIPEALPTGNFHLARDYDESHFEKRIRQYLECSGFSEVIHYSFCSEEEIKKAQLKVNQLIRLSNPLSEELAVMRPSLIPSLLGGLKRNLARQNEDLKLYEMRSFYETKDSSRSQPSESKSLCIAMTGQRYGKHWALPREKVDFYDLKGCIEGIWDLLRLPPFSLRRSEKQYLHPGISAEIYSDGESLGDWGLIHPQVAANFEIEVPLVIGEINLSRLMSFKKTSIHFESPPRFPSIERDLTLIVDEDLDSEAILREIRALKVPSLREICLFDVYQGEPIVKGKKALTYSIRYQESNRSLTDVEINQIHTQVVEKIKTVLPVEWR
jgi:phenylalanyl-tRNA synthetase beta chain